MNNVRLVESTDNTDNRVEDDETFLLRQLLLPDDVMLEVDQVPGLGGEVMRNQTIQHQYNSPDSSSCVSAM